MKTTKITESQRNELVAKIEAADLESPEQVADLVLFAGEERGYDAAIAQLAACVAEETPCVWCNGTGTMDAIAGMADPN